mgnify:CR=1 FL=1
MITYLPSLNTPASCDNRLRHGICGKYLQSLTALYSEWHGTQLSAFSGSCNTHLDRYPDAVEASASQILYEIVQ